MIGLVIVTHGGLAREFHATLEHVVGPQTQIATISIGPEDDAEVRRTEILDAVRATDSGGGVVILTMLSEASTILKCAFLVRQLGVRPLMLL